MVQGISGRVKRYVSVTARMDEDGRVRPLDPVVRRADVSSRRCAVGEARVVAPRRGRRHLQVEDRESIVATRFC